MTVITVTSLADNTTVDGLVTLREAIEAANTDTTTGDAPAGSGTDTIVFASGIGDPFENDAVIRLSGTELVITASVIIDGSTAGGAVVITGDAADNDATVSGTDITDVAATSAANFADNSRVFSITGGSTDATFVGLTITGGSPASE